MFDDPEENQDETMLSPRLRFALRLARGGMSPNNDQELSGDTSDGMSEGMKPGVSAMDGARSWLALQREPQIASKPTIGQRLMGASVAPKLTIGQRLMGIGGTQPYLRPPGSRIPQRSVLEVKPNLNPGASDPRRQTMALQGLGTAPPSAQVPRTFGSAATDPFAARAGATSRFGSGGLQISVAPPHPRAANAEAIDRFQESRANPKWGVGDRSTSGSTTGQAPVSRQIPLGGSPPPPVVPANAFDQSRIKTMTVEQVAGVVFGENGTGKYKVEPLPGRSTAEDLKRAKIAQAHAVINGDLRGGKHRPKTADWQTTEAQRKTPEYQQALDAARAAYQGHKLGTDPTGRRMFFNNRFEKDVGEHEEHLGKDRIVMDEKTQRAVGRQKPFLTYGPFTVGGGKVWTLVYDDTRPMDTKKQAPKKTGHAAQADKSAPVK